MSSNTKHAEQLQSAVFAIAVDSNSATEEQSSIEVKSSQSKIAKTLGGRSHET
jgi:hypothetical protein